MLTDHFENGDPNNDQNHRRHKDGMVGIGTFHGDDLRGLTNELDYLQQLGVNALQMSAPSERIHGWVGSGTEGDFPHYAYHGYYTQDQTNLDANMSSETDLRTLVGSVYQRGIHILFDIVTSHVSYATLADMQEYQFGALRLSSSEVKKTLGECWSDWRPAAGQTWHSFNDYTNFNDKTDWDKWWGKNWIRTDIGDYDNPGFDDLAMSLVFLPDIRTKSTTASGLLVFYRNKTDTHAKIIESFTPRDYLTHWLSQWIRDCGIDGFRIDIAKHIRLPAWQQLETEANAALREQKKANPNKALDDKPFWMTGETWGRSVMQGDYYRYGFDTMINFDYQEQAAGAVDCLAQMDTTWQQMAERLQDFNVLDYFSLHGTYLFRGGDDKAAELLLLAPDAV